MGKGISIAGRKTIFFHNNANNFCLQVYLFVFIFFSDLYANMQVLGYTPNKIEITKSVHKSLKGQVHSSAHPAH